MTTSSKLRVIKVLVNPEKFSFHRRLSISHPKLSDAPAQRKQRSTEENCPRQHNDTFSVKDNQKQQPETDPHGTWNKYKQSLKWSSIPVTVGVALFAYQYYWRVTPGECKAQETGSNGVHRNNRDWKLSFYKKLPLRTVSRAWGWVNKKDLPVWARGPVIEWYARTFKCEVQEAEVEDLRQYRNLGEFFRRSLKPGIRPIRESAVVSPVDGTVLYCGKLECGSVEQVKGVSYSLPTFLGPRTWTTRNTSKDKQNVDKQEYCKSLVKNAGNGLFQCVIYLAPGDYHRFHSPVDWTVNFRRHFGGELLSVNPRVAKWIKELFSLNERAVYIGEWEHGFFSYTAVGATNVGSIRVYEDNELTTNSRRVRKNSFLDKHFENELALEKGSQFGEFNLGSTIVLVFEAPLDFIFSVESGSKIRLGESLFQSKESIESKEASVDSNASRS